MKKVRVWHPIFFAIFPALSLLSHNIRELEISDALSTVSISLAGALLLFGVFKLLFRNSHKAAILVSLFAVLFFSYGHLYKALGVLHLDKTIISRTSIFMPALLSMYAIVGFFVLRTKKELTNITSVLNRVSLALVIVAVGGLVIFETTNRSKSASVDLGLDSDIAALTTQSSDKPDIYYIIFDRYASDTTLKDYYNHDNSSFTQYLESKDFYVAKKSIANYQTTRHSLATSLNMEYLNYLSKTLSDSPDNKPLNDLIENNKVQKFLRKQGYKYIHMGSWWTASDTNKNADLNLRYKKGLDISEFSSQFLENTAAYPIISKIGKNSKKDPDARREFQKNNDKFQFAVMPEVAKSAGPKFVFAHFLIPHHPYVFDRNGKEISVDVVNKRTEKENYVEQLIYANKRIQEMVDAILKNSAKDPIIIIQGDEGPYTEHSLGESHDKGFDWNNLPVDELKEKVRIINAYHLPGEGAKELLYQDITPVNTFRIVFNKYFGSDLKLLDDVNYLYQNEAHPYRFTNISKRVEY